MTPRSRTAEADRLLASTDRPLRVLVNALAFRVGGGGSYAVGQLAELSKLEGLSLTIMAAPDIAQRLRATCHPSVRVRALPRRGLARRLLFEQLILPFRVRDHDVVYQAAGFAMFASPRPQAVTNQNAHHFGAAARAFTRKRYPRRLRARHAIQRRAAHASVRRAEAFITVSRAFQDTVEEDLGHRHNVHMLPSAAPPLPAAIPAADEGLGEEPYTLTVAHDYPHKDWDKLIRAFIEHRDLPRLAIAGQPRSEERRAQLARLINSSGAEDRILLLGELADRTRIAALYRGASCFVAHSFLEAGPMTPLEAITAGVRLVASDIPPHREAAARHAVYYDPRDLDGLAAAVRKVLNRTSPADPVDSGPHWTWADNARQLAAILRSIARPSKGGRQRSLSSV